MREKLQVQHQIEELHGVIQRQQPVVVKVGRRLLDLNRSFGERGHLNVAGKLYLLFLDTDIDVMFLTGGSRRARFGMDFSRNLRSNLEVHGEMTP